MIGNTPMIKIKYKYNNKINEVYTKLEYYNYSGSIKDRIVKYIIEKNNLPKGSTVCEATSGNTGIALAALGAKYGLKVVIFIPKSASIERINLMRLYGATVIITESFDEAIKGAYNYSVENNCFLCDQFNNKLNLEAHYNTTAVEIYNSVNNIGAFISGVGTGGTLMGISKYLKSKNQNTKCVALEPASMPLISENKIIGPHKIEGIGDDFVPSLVDRDIIDDIILVNDDDAVNMSRLLSKHLGLGVGISSGANFIASVLTKDKMDENVVTVFADDSKKYLSTDLMKDIDTNKDFISNKIELIEIKKAD